MDPKCYEISARISNLEEEIRTLNAHNQELGNALREKRRYRDETKNKVESLTQRLYDLEGEISNLANTRDEARGDLADIKRDIADAKRAYAEATDDSRRSDIQWRLRELKGAANQRQERIGSITSRIADKRHYQQELNYEKTDAAYRLGELNSKVDSMEFEASQTRARRDRRETELERERAKYERTCTPGGELKNKEDNGWFTSSW